MRPAEFGGLLAKITEPGELLHAMGGAGRTAATKIARRDLGHDRAFSGLRRRVVLGSGYDFEDDAVVLHMRPKGLWMLAGTGRHRQGTIRPRKGKRAVVTPKGLRAQSHYTPSRGLRTVDDALNEMRETVPVAAIKAMAANIRKAGL